MDLPTAAVGEGEGSGERRRVGFEQGGETVANVLSRQQKRDIMLRRRQKSNEIKKRYAARVRGQHEEEEKQLMKQQEEEFKKGMQNFCVQNWEEIQRDQQFREIFCDTCCRLGLDPALSFALTAKHSRREEYIAALAVCILDVCAARRDYDGGLAELDVVLDLVRRRCGQTRQGEAVVTKDDAISAIKNLGELGSGIRLLAFGGKEYVKSMASELSTDWNVLLDLFHKCQGRFTRREAMDDLRWSEERVADGLTGLAREGLVMIDDPGEAMPRLYWCPAVSYNVNLAL